MDRYLLSGAVLLLTFLIIVLLGDMDILPYKLLHFESETRSEKSIGTVIQTKQNVRRRSNSAIFWENTRKSDELYNYDSILTLENSSSEISLTGNIKLQLHENTLIVLEPKNEFEQGAFKIRFDRGDLRSRSAQRFRVGSGEWVIEAQQGSDLSVKSVTGDNIEVEVHGGEAIVQNEKTNTVPQQIVQGQRAVLDAKNQTELRNVSEDMRFMDRLYQRIYSHDFPVEFKVAWKGPAKKLRILSPGKKLEYVELSEEIQDHTMQLNPGSYYFYLEDNERTSESLGIHVWPAEKITYFSPLPRDRIRTGTPNVFAWSELEAAEKYHVHFSSGEAFQSDDRKSDITLVTEGEMEWSVYAEDDEGFLIPPPYGYPLYSVPDPLAPPELIEPMLREPANDEIPDDQGSILEKIFSFFIPIAHAKTSYRGDLIFEWSKVPGADFYTIEISSNPDFRTPEIIVNADSEKFVWQNYAHEIYYWRVAGGQKNGRMGLFSKVQKLNLKNLETLKGSDVSAGVKIVRHLKIEPLAKAKKLPAKKKLVEVPRIEPPPSPPAPLASSEPELKIVVRKAPEPEPTPKVEKPIDLAERDLAFIVDLGMYYDFSQLKATDNVVANFNGFRPYNLNFGVTFPTDWNASIMAKVNYNYIIWKADPEGDYPFQPKLSEHRYGVNLHYRQTDSPWFYGTRVEQFSYPERVGLEEIRLKNIMFYGLSGGYVFDTSVFELRSIHTLNLLFGDGQIQFQAMNEFLYSLDLAFPTDAGLELNLRYFNGAESQSGFLGQFGLFIRAGF